jgi:Domain of unknown function (DUF4180)
MLKAGPGSRAFAPLRLKSIWLFDIIDGMGLELTVSDEAGVRFVEGPPDRPLMRSTEDATLLVEACFLHRAKAALLYAPNLTERFFDLSSGEAGSVLQKLRNYRIRLAVVCPPGSVQFSGRFGEMAAEESRTGYFQVCDSDRAAREWLSKT